MDNRTYLERFAIPLETLREVATNSPKAAPVTGVDARALVRVLATYTGSREGVAGQDGNPYWMMSMKEVAAAYMKQTGAQDITPTRMGLMLAGMGLQRHRYATGVVTVWNRRQLDILKKHFNL